MPTGQFIDGLPIAIQLVGPYRSDALMLKIAAWCEQALGARPLAPPELANR